MNDDDDRIDMRFYQIPPVPGSVYAGVEKRIRRRSRAVRSVTASCAVLAVAAGISLYNNLPVRNPAQNDTAVSVFISEGNQAGINDEIDAELQAAYEFVNGTSLEYEYAQYVPVNISLY